MRAQPREDISLEALVERDGVICYRVAIGDGAYGAGNDGSASLITVVTAVDGAGAQAHTIAPRARQPTLPRRMTEHYDASSRSINP